MVTCCIVQARMGSTRLPGKVMMRLDGKNTILYYVISQLQQSRLVDNIIIATTTLKEDDRITEFAEDQGLNCFRGSPDNVLDRYYKCAKKFSISIIVRVTSDNPLIDPVIIDRVIKKFNSGSYDYVTNCHPRTFPQGTEVEIFSFRSLKKAWLNAEKPSEREHVTAYFYNNPDKFKMFNIRYSKNISHLRWTVDRKDDLKLVRLIVSKIKKRPILMKDIINLLSREPQLININKKHVTDEGYQKSLKEDTEFLSPNKSKL